MDILNGIKMTTIESAKAIRSFLTDAEKLKTELRHSYLTNGRQESVADHVWRMALLAMLIEPNLSKKIDTERVLKIILIHDLVEIYAGDIPLTESSTNPSIKKIKEEKERDAIEKIKIMLPKIVGEDIYALWWEYEDNKTFEAQFAHALDKIEAQAQHNEAGIHTWVEDEYHFAYRLPKYTANEKILEEISSLLMDEVDEMLDSISYDKASLISKI